MLFLAMPDVWQCGESGEEEEVHGLKMRERKEIHKQRTERMMVEISNEIERLPLLVLLLVLQWVRDTFTKVCCGKNLRRFRFG